ncbi:MAG: endo alpha-1,4 polygalactosaminidase [Phycisphaerae bacterium]|nr:MAG: endo alpha-1,4 polygalactosaminidase [Phycisphaerae bacterium]
MKSTNRPSTVRHAAIAITFTLVAMTLFAPAGCAPVAPNGSDQQDDQTDTFDPDAPPITEGDWVRPSMDATWQWQLQPDVNGEINTSYNADLYDIDLFDVSASFVAQLKSEGRIVIAYFSAGTFEDFRSDADEFLPAEIGTALGDFPDERWLDIRTSNVRRIMQARLDLAVEKGFDGVEPDNVTGFSNDSGFDLTADDQLAFNRFIANEAHMRGLSVGLKNDLDQILQLVDYFDFAVNEQCHEFDECAANDPFIKLGKPVFNAEYADPFVNSEKDRNDLCELAINRGLQTLILPIDLDDAFRFSCVP